LGKKGQTSALVLSTLAMIVSFSVWSVFPPIAGKMQELFRLSSTEISILIATPVLLGSLMRIPMGILTDRYGGRRVFALTLIFLIIPLIAAGLATSYGVMLLCALFIGMAGTTFAISITFVSKWYPPQKQGLILGIAGMGNLGAAVASYTIPIVLASYGISWVFWGLALALGVTTLVLWMGTQDSPGPKATKTLQESLSVLRYRTTWYLSLFYFLTFGGFVAFSVYLPTFLKELYNFQAFDAGLKTAGFVVLATLIRPVGGYLSDQFGAKKVLTVVFTAIFFCALFITFTLENFTSFTIGCLAMALALGTGNGAVFKMVPEISSGNTGAVTGIVGAAGGIGGFFPPIVLGVVKDQTGSYEAGFLLLVIFSLVCLFIHLKGIKKTKTELRVSENMH